MSAKGVIPAVAVILILLTSLYSMAMPMHPDLYARLKKEGRLEEVIRSLNQAREKGVFAPNPYPPVLRTSKAAPFDQPTVVLLVDFSDKAADTAHYSVAHFDSMLFSKQTYPTGSMYDFYLENSYGGLEITGAVTVWLRMPQPYSYYTDGQYGWGNYPKNAQRLTEDAVLAADSLVDFSKFDVDGNGWVDAVFVVHAGPGGEVTGNPWDIWSHAWATSYPIAVDNVLVYGYSMEPEDGRIGVFSHELGHVLGLPDLYDYGGDSNGLGDWTIMAGGSWGNGGITPVHFDAWCKTKLGFITPIEVAPGTLDVVQLPPVEYSQVVYKMYMDNQPDFQYFLVENRRKKGFDYYLPGPGLLIYHCDDTVSTGNNLQWYPGYTDSGHFLVALEQADGQWGLEKNYGSNNGDPYPGTWSKFTLNDTTIPDTRTYSFLSTGVCVEKISTSMDTMTASLCGGSPIGILQSSAEGKMQSAKLGQNVPNPFRSATLISYTLSSASHVSVEIYDLSGALVETLKDGMDGPGAHQVYWNPKNHESGIFFYRLKAGAFEYTRKMILVR